MNQTIIDLAEQAAEAVVEYEHDVMLRVEHESGAVLEIPADFIAKFSELLIKDCASKVKHVAKQGGGTYGETILQSYDLPPRYD